jgi:F-type H+-transporting ATPase subunit epsilon
MAALNVSVVSADREIWSGEASMVVARTVEGQIGILPGHEPMLAVLASGEVRVSLPSGEKVTANAEDGFLSVQSNVVQIVASRASLN